MPFFRFPAWRAVTPVIIGIMIYAVFRGIAIIHLPALILTSPTIVMIIVADNLPDGLWLYALLQALHLIWRDMLFTKGLLWFCLAVAGAISSEAAQYWHIIPGTCDWGDVMAYLFAAIIFLLQYIPRHTLKITI